MTTDETAILALYRTFHQAKVAQDIATLEAILSPDFHLIHMTGKDQTREEWLADVSDGSMRYFASSEEHIAYTVEGNRAQLTGQNRVDARIYGHRSIWPLQLIFTLEKRNGRWQATRALASMY